MKKPLVVFFFFAAAALFANDFRWNLVNALARNDYPAAENLINQNINIIPAAERRIMINFTLTYSHGDTALRTLELLQRHNVRPSGFDLYTAINRNQPDTIVDFLIDGGAAANGEILLLAAEKQRFDLAARFIQAGVDVNYQYPLTRNDSDGMTALLYASRYNNFDLVQMLVEKGADINARNREGGTALSISQTNANAQISSFLIERGAVQTLANTGQTRQNFQQTGIAGFLEAQVQEFQPGIYRLARGTSGANRDLLFTGDANSGIVGYAGNDRMINGAYHTAGAHLTVILSGSSFIYRIDSAGSFSGNGEVWIRR